MNALYIQKFIDFGSVMKRSCFYRRYFHKKISLKESAKKYIIHLSAKKNQGMKLFLSAKNDQVNEKTLFKS